MAITHLTIEGFRSLKRVEWSPARLNVLIGPNGSGKSNLLRALRLLRSAAEGKLSAEVLSSGGMGALVRDSSATRITWGIAFEQFVYELTLARIGTSAEHHALAAIPRCIRRTSRNHCRNAGERRIEARRAVGQ